MLKEQRGLFTAVAIGHDQFELVELSAHKVQIPCSVLSPLCSTILALFISFSHIALITLLLIFLHVHLHRSIRQLSHCNAPEALSNKVSFLQFSVRLIRVHGDREYILENVLIRLWISYEVGASSSLCILHLQYLDSKSLISRK